MRDSGAGSGGARAPGPRSDNYMYAPIAALTSDLAGVFYQLSRMAIQSAALPHPQTARYDFCRYVYITGAEVLDGIVKLCGGKSISCHRNY